MNIHRHRNTKFQVAISCDICMYDINDMIQQSNFITCDILLLQHRNIYINLLAKRFDSILHHLTDKIRVFYQRTVCFLLSLVQGIPND